MAEIVKLHQKSKSIPQSLREIADALENGTYGEVRVKDAVVVLRGRDGEVLGVPVNISDWATICGLLFAAAHGVCTPIEVFDA